MGSAQSAAQPHYDGDPLLALTQRQGLSFAALARSAGLSRQQLADWRARRKTPALPSVVRLADAAGVEVHALAEALSRAEAPS